VGNATFKVGAVTACLLLLTVVPLARAEDTPASEYEVKAAFLYNFLKFVDWPKTKTADSNEPMIIGVIGDDVFQNALDALERKTVGNRRVVVKRFPGMSALKKAGEREPSTPYPHLQGLRASHLLFVCPSERQHTQEILRSVEGHHVLTVADTPGFLEAGGVINLLTEEKRVHFEINLVAAKKAELRIRSAVLRLARRVYTPPED